MFRKTIIALFAVAAVGLVSPTVASAVAEAMEVVEDFTAAEAASMRRRISRRWVPRSGTWHRSRSRLGGAYELTATPTLWLR